MTPIMRAEAEQAQAKLEARRCRTVEAICRGSFISHFSDDPTEGCTIYLYKGSEEVGKQEFHSLATRDAVLYQNAWLFSGKIVF